MEKKTLFISHSAGRTGAPLLLLNFLKWLKENSPLSFEILLLQDGPLRSEFAALAPVHIFPQQETAIDQLLAVLRENRIGLVYANTIVTGRALQSLAPLMCPAITHIHELDYWIERSGEENLQQIIRHTDHYIAGSRAVRENLVRNYGLSAEKINVVHEFIPTHGITADPSGIRQQFGIPEEAFVILGSGHETWRKGKNLFVQLAALVRKALPGQQTHFLWVGGWQNLEDRRNILHDVHHLGLDGRVHFTEEVTNTHNYFAAGDVFAMVSRDDPFPLVCLEAAVLGKPVLCFADSGGMPEFVEEDAGFVVPYLDLEAMTKKIAALFADPLLKTRLGKRAADKVRELYNVRTGSEKIEKIIKKVQTTVHQAKDRKQPGKESQRNFFVGVEDQLSIIAQQLNDTLERHRKEVEDIHNSLSWKITAPLRAIAKLIRNQ